VLSFFLSNKELRHSLQIAPPLLGAALPRKGCVGLGGGRVGGAPHLPGLADPPPFPDDAPLAERVTEPCPRAKSLALVAMR
jgi:hypothetical protein